MGTIIFYILAFIVFFGICGIADLFYNNFIFWGLE